MKSLVIINSVATLVLLVMLHHIENLWFWVSLVVWISTIVPICIKLDNASEERRKAYGGRLSINELLEDEDGKRN